MPEQFIILLVLGAVALIKWLLEKSAELREKQRTEERLDRLEREQPASPLHAPRPVARPLPDMEAAERRLREALGLPGESELPPPRMPPAPEPAFRIEEVRVVPPADLEQRPVVPPQPMPAKKRAASRPPSPQTVAAPVARSGLQDLLGSREGLRKAILAQEILGTPKGLVF